MSGETCRVCEKPIEDGQPVQFDLDGGVAHSECVEVAEPDDDEEGR